MRINIKILLVALSFFILGFFGFLFLFLNSQTKSSAVKKSTAQENLAKKENPLKYFSQKRMVSIDDDPFMGEENAPLTLIEFSDFECGNCKLFFLQTLPLLKDNYINTGKLKLVYRDFPVKSHDPLATQEAMAATCAKEQQGNEGYFKYHDAIFNTTTSGGRGLEISQLFSLANNLKLNSGLFKECFETERYKNEAQKDFSDGMAVSVTGTPTFFLGKTSENGTISGYKISGAMPYAAFKIIIEELLKSNERSN